MRKLRMPIAALMTVIAHVPAEWANVGFGQVTSPVQSTECDHVTAERWLAPSEVKELLKSARSPGDHLELAAHFGEEAAQEDAAANWHDQKADSSESSAIRRHHKRLANNARRAAEHAMKRAQEQARIAQAMQSSPATGTRHGR